MPGLIPKYLITGELELVPKYDFAGLIKNPYNSQIIQTILEKTQKINKL